MASSALPLADPTVQGYRSGFLQQPVRGKRRCEFMQRSIRTRRTADIVLRGDELVERYRCHVSHKVLLGLAFFERGTEGLGGRARRHPRGNGQHGIWERAGR
jgi:hypothetical protein